MRDIKFRAWDSRKESMWSPEHFKLRQDDEGYYIVASGGFGAIRGVELMQYTGLKDKNGVEIYEGDIVGYYAYPDLKRWTRRFEIKWQETTRTTGFNISKGHTLNQLERVEVIGNRWEKPELLSSEVDQ